MVIAVTHLINEDPYAFARSVDMTSRRVVATFNHRRHADDQLVVHTYDLLGLFPDLPFESTVELIEERDIFHIARIVRDIELVPSPSPAVIEVTDIYLVYALAVVTVVVETVTGIVILIKAEPLIDIILELGNILDWLINTKVI